MRDDGRPRVRNRVGDIELYLGKVDFLGGKWNAEWSSCEACPGRGFEGHRSIWAHATRNCVNGVNLEENTHTTPKGM